MHQYAPGLVSSTVDQVLKYTKYPKYLPSTSTGQVKKSTSKINFKVPHANKADCNLPLYL